MAETASNPTLKHVGMSQQHPGRLDLEENGGEAGMSAGTCGSRDLDAVLLEVSWKTNAHKSSSHHSSHPLHDTSI